MTEIPMVQNLRRYSLSGSPTCRVSLSCLTLVQGLGQSAGPLDDSGPESCSGTAHDVC